MTGFTPDQPNKQLSAVPFFEDQTDAKIPGRATEKPIAKLQEEIRDLMLKLNAYGVQFTQGKFDGAPARYGYEMTFMYEGTSGRMRIAALPIRSETPRLKDRALAQSLYLVRDWLEAEAFSQVYRPGTVPLLPYLIGTNGQTVTEAFIASGMLMLGSGQ